MKLGKLHTGYHGFDTRPFKRGMARVMARLGNERWIGGRPARRLLVWRRCWDHGEPGDGHGFSNEISIGLWWQPRDVLLGWFTVHEFCGYILRLCVPLLQLRIHYKRSYGGRYPPRDWLGRG